jgi:hypothetical protein
MTMELIEGCTLDQGIPGIGLSVMRTTAEWVDAEASSGGRLLSSVERQALARMRKELAGAQGPDIDSALALIDAPLEHGMKLEQNDTECPTALWHQRIRSSHHGDVPSLVELAASSVARFAAAKLRFR